MIPERRSGTMNFPKKVQSIQYSKPKLRIEFHRDNQDTLVCVNHQIGVMNSCNGYLATCHLFAICPPVALCGLRQNHPGSSASLPLLSGINQANQPSAFLPRHRLIVYLSFANNFSIHQPVISRNLHFMLFFHWKPPCMIGYNARRLDLVSQFRHQIGPMTTAVGVFCARLWEIVRALCPFSK